ncbi:hypothetical protein ACFW1A_27060 [Kitasatospora sp. NPDC058965]|uniref:hypothetical protein n=1 Tax=Kitasatospora sp. NPDC058965 TaxID=3346682 RepID=UPI0036AF3B82
MSIPDGSPQGVVSASSDGSTGAPDVVSGGGRVPWGGVGGPRGKGRVWLVGGVVVAVLVAVGAVSGLLTSDGGRPVALGSLGAGSCFRLPAHPDRSFTGSSGVVRVACAEPHYGEVIARPAVDLAGAGTTDRVVGARKACREPMADYNPDFWAAPANVAMEVVPPTEQELKDHPSATCLYAGRSFLLTGSLRADPSRLNAAQRQYLDAVRPYDGVSAEGLDGWKGAGDADLTAWAKEMVAAEQQTLEALRRIGPPAGAEEQFGHVLDQHRMAVGSWQAAAASDTTGEIRDRIASARAAEHDSMDAAQAVRGALGLTTAMRPTGYSL